MAHQYFGDPDSCFAQYDADQNRELSYRPICCDCGEPIQDEHLYIIEGEFYCTHCLESNHRHYTNDYVKETA